MNTMASIGQKIALTVAALSSSAAFAASLVNTASFAAAATDTAAEPLQVALFDPTLGVLDSVSVTLTGVLTSSAQVSNNSTSLNLTNVAITLAGDFSAALLGAGPAALPGNVLLLAPGGTLGTTTFTILGPGAHTAMGPFTTSASGATFVFTAPAETQGFVGIGSFGYAFSSATSASFPGRFTTVSVDPLSLSSATLKVEYSYTAPVVSSVPEPGSGAMALAGLGMGGLMLRRRRSAFARSGR